MLLLFHAVVKFCSTNRLFMFRLQRQELLFSYFHIFCYFYTILVYFSLLCVGFNFDVCASLFRGFLQFVLDFNRAVRKSDLC